MAIYQCSHCDMEKDSDVEPCTLIYNSIRDDYEAVCDDCLNDIADGIRTDYEYIEMLSASK